MSYCGRTIDKDVPVTNAPDNNPGSGLAPVVNDLTAYVISGAVSPAAVVRRVT